MNRQGRRQGPETGVDQGVPAFGTARTGARVEDATAVSRQNLQEKRFQTENGQQ
jgi:hypothetical protein